MEKLRFQIPNTSTVTKDEDKQSTNKIQTHLTPIKESIKKYIIDDRKAVDIDTITKEDSVVAYYIDNVVPNDVLLKSLMLFDMLDKSLEVFDQNKIKVITFGAKVNEVKVSENKEEIATNQKIRKKKLVKQIL